MDTTSVEFDFTKSRKRWSELRSVDTADWNDPVERANFISTVTRNANVHNIRVVNWREKD